RLALTFYVRKDDARTRRLILLLALLNMDPQPAGVRKHTGATFLDWRQFNVAEKPRPARLPEKFELERIQRHVGMNRTRVGDEVGEFKIANHVNYAAFAFDFHARSRRRMHG